MTHLAGELTKQYKNWRDTTVFLLDGVSFPIDRTNLTFQASYHKTADSRACYQHLGLNVVLSAPYSYAAAPVELWFARLKQGDLNPGNIKTGKR